MASEVDTQVVNTQDVANFFELLRTLASSSSTTWIDQVLKDNQKMKANVKEREHDNISLLRAITKLTNELDAEIAKSKDAISQSEEAKAKAGELTTEIEGAKKTIADKDQKLEEDATTIAALKGNVDALGKDIQSRDDTIKKHEEKQANDGARIQELEGLLGTTRTRLEATSSQLKEIQSLSCKVVDGSKDFVLEEINKIYGYAKSVAMQYFHEDLPDDILANGPLFEEIRKFVRPIPLPASNSVPAKKARVAAFLYLLGSRLADQIFLPFYVPPPEEQQSGIDSIAIMLSDLSIADPKRELHLRSVLLATAPGEQRKIAYDRADDIATEVFDILGILLRPDLQVSFHNDIRKLCRLAVESWDTLRPLREKVEPFTETEEDTEKYWLPAELDGVSYKKQPQANGKQNGLGSKPSMHSLKSANKVILVWPGFSYGAEVLKQGFMLLDSQVRLAEEEAQPLKRNQRAMHRALTGSPRAAATCCRAQVQDAGTVRGVTMRQRHHSFASRALPAHARKIKPGETAAALAAPCSTAISASDWPREASLIYRLYV
ncbi:hypothetical protein O1611_g6799 [Lasiodiplodia mahajangana]|uniref:Uncharacterized protein n=1 Tax=Lasiodiplodia mahajangana TaxID=1108764 RepID=A0ACC2JHJ9_9PEZI|nr:hypothetical protein O1611_g6799 [Lasiodiplodia mahajangana]